MEPNQIICGSNIDVVKSWPTNCIDGICTDPPYGLEFMGKEWDKLGDASIEPTRDSAGGFLRDGKSGSNPYAAARIRMGSDTNSMQRWHYQWAKAMLRITKPGGFLLCFGGTRTFHRLTCAIEDAGWEIRDCMMWLYGQGFPKSTDISLQMDRATCREQLVRKLSRKPTKEEFKKTWENFRKIVGDKGYTSQDMRGNAYDSDRAKDRERLPAKITAPATDLAQLWNGYGTALKPAWEIILCAEKPLTYKEFTAIMAHRIKETLCQLKSFVKTVKKDSLLNHRGQNVVCPDSAVWLAVEKCNTPEDLLGLMDTLPSELEIPLSLNIGLLWLNTLAEIYLRWNTFTIEMVTGLTTDLKILNSLQSMLTPASLIQVATGQLGIESNVERVASLFSAVKMKLNDIPDVSVQDNAISKAHHSYRGGLVPNWEPIIVAMKPLDGTFAHNAERHGVAGLNIDAARIGTGDRRMCGTTDKSGETSYVLGAKEETKTTQGRWPANLILDEEVADGESWKRYFYCAKTSRKERNMGMEDCEDKLLARSGGAQGAENRGEKEYSQKHIGLNRVAVVKNNHPTVKPLALMKYLCTLLKMPSAEQIILDPFMGSGTTGMACADLGIGFIGIEKESEYCQISQKRIAAVLGKTLPVINHAKMSRTGERFAGDKLENVNPVQATTASPNENPPRNDEHRQSIINAASAALRRNRK